MHLLKIQLFIVVSRKYFLIDCDHNGNAFSVTCCADEQPTINMPLKFHVLDLYINYKLLSYQLMIVRIPHRESTIILLWQLFVELNDIQEETNLFLLVILVDLFQQKNRTRYFVLKENAMKIL